MIVWPSLFKGMGGHKTRANSSASQYVASELSPSYFPRLPVRPPCRRFHLPPPLPQAISHGFPSVHPVVASISLLPNEALPKLFPTVSPPPTLSSLPSRSLPTEQLFPTASRPSLSSLPHPFHLAPSQRSSPQAISHGSPSTLSSLQSRSFQRSSPQAISHGSPSTLSSLQSRSFQRSSPQAISRGSPSTLSSLPSRSLPTEPSPSYFPQFPLRPPSRRFHIAPLAAKSTKRERKHRRCFWEKHLKISKDKCQEMTSKWHVNHMVTRCKQGSRVPGNRCWKDWRYSWRRLRPFCCSRRCQRCQVTLSGLQRRSNTPKVWKPVWFMKYTNGYTCYTTCYQNVLLHNATNIYIYIFWKTTVTW